MAAILRIATEVVAPQGVYNLSARAHDECCQGDITLTWLGVTENLKNDEVGTVGRCCQRGGHDQRSSHRLAWGERELSTVSGGLERWGPEGQVMGTFPRVRTVPGLVATRGVHAGATTVEAGVFTCVPLVVRVVEATLPAVTFRGVAPGVLLGRIGGPLTLTPLRRLGDLRRGYRGAG